MVEAGADRWAARPTLAACVRLLVLLVPVVAGIVAAILLVQLLPRATTTAGEVGWWAVVLAGALLAAQGVELLARRALPLAALLTLSLVFPDRAPSRLRTARRTSIRELERQVDLLERTDEPGRAAAALVALVGALGLHDRRTRGHSERVRAYVDLISEELGLPEPDRERLRWAALLHDVGKLTVPGAVLNGGRDLAPDEWEALRAHPMEGERLAAGLMPWLGEWGRVVREHHERWDGHGYPLGLAGDEISRGARIVAVADAYEVMTANRSYQKAVSAGAARVELSRCAGSDFDPAVVRAFLQISIGRLRGVLGPASLLPVAFLGLFGRRAGDALKGVTTAAAVTAVAVGVTTAPAHLRTPQTPERIGIGSPVVVPSATASPSPPPAPVVVTPQAVRRSAPVAARSAPPAVAPAPVVTAAPTVVPLPSPTPTCTAPGHGAPTPVSAGPHRKDAGKGKAHACAKR